MGIPKYEIIATLGPSSDTKQMWDRMANIGVTGFRLNTSHLSQTKLHFWLERLHSFLGSTGKKLVLDLQGSKWRLGRFESFDLIQGKTVILTYAESTKQAGILPVPHQDFFQTANTIASDPSPIESKCNEIILNDAKIVLLMETVSKDSVIARIKHGGHITAHKGITFTNSEYRHECLSEKDRTIVEDTISLPYIQYAMSYVKDTKEMCKYRSLLGRSVFLIAKLERQSAIDEVAMIADFADELWLCRGDLGAELGMKKLAEQTHMFSKCVQSIPKPVLMAGQILEHMTQHTIPTRSEICFLYETLLLGYQGVVLSDETAIGQDPVGSCQMAAIFQPG